MERSNNGMSKRGNERMNHGWPINDVASSLSSRPQHHTPPHNTPPHPIPFSLNPSLVRTPYTPPHLHLLHHHLLHLHHHHCPNPTPCGYFSLLLLSSPGPGAG